MLTVFLGLGAALSWGFHDFIIQPATRRVGAFAAMFWVLLISSAALMTTALALDGLPNGAVEWRAVGISAGGGITYVLGVATLYHALAVGKLSLVTPLVALSGGAAAISAIVLGERIGAYAVAALPLAVVGAVLASVLRGGDGAGVEVGDPGARPAAGLKGETSASPASGVHAASGTGWALLCAALFGATFLLYGQAGHISPVSAAGWGRVTGLLLFLPFALMRVEIRMPPGVYWRTVVCALLDSAAYVAMTAATARGPVAVASALSTQFATVAVVLGLFVRRERPTRVQLIGVGLTIGAVVLFSLAA